jgi:hypothetical protein
VNFLQTRTRQNSPANRASFRLLRLKLRQAVLAFDAGCRSQCPAFFVPIALSLQNAEHLVFRILPVVSKQHHSVHGMHISLAVVVVFRFSLWMIRRNKTDSKLCASLTRHATGGRLSAVADGSTCKGASPRCIPRYRADEARRYA